MAVVLERVGVECREALIPNIQVGRLRRERASMLALVGMVTLGMGLLPEPVAGAEAVPSGLKARFHQDLRTADLNNPNLKPIGERVRHEAAGARVTLPAGAGQLATTGLATTFTVHGDFEITLAYEVLKADRPTTGYGVGVSIYAAINTDTSDAASLARRVMPMGGAVFMSDRMTGDGDANHKVTTRPSTASAGRLRLRRVGSKLHFLLSEENRPEFEQVDEVEFGTADLRWLQFGGDAGGSESGLDLRLLDLSVAAEDLPGLVDLPETPPTRPDPPRVASTPKQPAPPTQPRKADGWGWMAAMVLGGVGIASSLALGAWLFVRRGRRRGQSAAGKPATVAPPRSFPCSGCGKRLKVKAELVGKKVKCPHCGRAGLVPAS
jgi:hypothetical protein